MSLLLASKSETRRHMLEAAGIAFDVVGSDLAEEEAKDRLVSAGFDPRDLAQMLAEMKATKVIARPEDWVLGADQTLELANGSLLSKAGSRDEARDQLRSLAGTTHQLHSAAVVARSGRRIWGASETARLRMRTFDDPFIEAYLDREYDHVRWNVGVYRIEGFGIQLFDEIQGSHFAILGLPLLPLLAFLREQGLVPG